MKALIIAFLVFLLLALFLINSYTGFFTEVEKSEEKAKSEWYLVGKVEILNGRIVNIELKNYE